MAQINHRSAEQRGIVETLRHLTDEAFLEHDCYILFERLILPMQGSFIESGDQSITRRIDHVTSLVAGENPAILRHLSEIGVIPSMFLVRWLRLLLSREFPVGGVFFLWDRFFASGDGAFHLLDGVSAGLLLSRGREVCGCGGIAEALGVLQDGGKSVSVRLVWAVGRGLGEGEGEGEGEEKREGRLGRWLERVRERVRGCVAGRERGSGRLMGGQSMNGQSMNGQSMNGSMNGQLMNGSMNGSMNGQSMNGQSMNSQSMNGQSMNGQSMNGQSMNGQSISDQSINERIPSQRINRSDQERMDDKSLDERNDQFIREPINNQSTMERADNQPVPETMPNTPLIESTPAETTMESLLKKPSQSPRDLQAAADSILSKYCLSCFCCQTRWSSFTIVHKSSI